MASASCSAITDSSMFGTYGLFDETKPGCDSAEQFFMGKPKFYGKNNANGQPMFVALDYENFKIARTGMIISTCTAAVLGITAIVLAVKLAKK